MITLEGRSLVFRFPQVHEHAHTEIEFQRTLRIPDDGKHYPLPPGLGSFPLHHLDDFARRVPRDWRERGGVMMPLYQAEAMWISFRRACWSEGYPCAIKIASGKINAVSGKPWKAELDGTDRDYVVVPEQPWLDGFCVAKDVVRQFVAMPLGSGYSVEEQVTGKAEHGGLQIIVYPMKKERYEAILREREEHERMHVLYAAVSCYPSEHAAMPRAAMGLAAGGRMSQQIYDDPYGLDAWDQSVSSRCFVTLVDAVQWREITGEAPPTKPPTAADYTRAGLPWFDYYASDLATLAGAPELTRLKSVTEMAEEKGEDPFGPEQPLDPNLVVK
ncbi:MAG TPA: hypothetical protein VNK52_06135, partial [Hyphomicrobiaceae bacterium]|nr:hypothetical protein [Hyphomicrobiaceae bacterium]